MLRMSLTASALVGTARTCGDASETSSDAAEDVDLPECKIKRNYNCSKCNFYTQNPRAYLLHVRDDHFVKMKIFECALCTYASKHQQKLKRHIKMVHFITDGRADMENFIQESKPFKPAVKESTDGLSQTDKVKPNSRNGAHESTENMFEEVEDFEANMDFDDNDEEALERLAEDSFERDRPTSTNATKGKGNFSCDKCSYVTHIKGRYTKHVKYHSMPMIKCTICEFRTPYKWNLDRHMKNHGGNGVFSCSVCNFTADIRQSLTVHEMNHHTPAVGQSSLSRRRNRVGASDALDRAAGPNSDLIAKDETSGDSSSAHSNSEMTPQSSKMELVSQEMISKEESIHDIQNTSNSSTEDVKSKSNLKRPRPIPQLIPLSITSTPNQTKINVVEPPAKKIKETNCNNFTNLLVKSTGGMNTLNPPNIKENGIRKKNESFFDKLKERILTETGEDGSLICKNCRFESKCLSEHTVHEKNCTSQNNRLLTNANISNLSSTRCQNCRHRCKSSADLYVHLQTCRKDENLLNQNIKLANSTETFEKIKDTPQDSAPHPMENVVFVWNNIDTQINKFETPLDININDDSTLPENNQIHELEIADDNESMNLSPSQALGKKVYKCPNCSFWASTASRFHVHIVGHLNKKPFECSLCKYKSNWRWDITKHIKLKSARDPEHNDAKVLMTDETGRRNYSKYNRFLAISIKNENGENEFHFIEPNVTIDSSTTELEDQLNDLNDNTQSPIEIQPLNLQTQHNSNIDERNDDTKKAKKTLWKCKKCNYKDQSKDALLEHVKQHSKSNDTEDLNDANFNKKKEPETINADLSDLAYRCGHCNQLSNWKHVIQRHCRLKHDGVIKVITTEKPKSDFISPADELTGEMCSKCPFRSSDKNAMISHTQQHQPSLDSIFKCYFCPFFVKNEFELLHHLPLHGVTDPEEYISKALGCTSPLTDSTTPQPTSGNKRHKCTECPYETNSKSQYLYHEQFHKLSSDTPYKCPVCNYSVSKRHLLNQHVRVHGIIPKKNDTDLDLEEISPALSKNVVQPNLDEIPFVWVSAKNEFHKMYKCRYCSYVNSQKCKIPIHEKIHCMVFEDSDVTIYKYKCLECKYTSDSDVKLAAHSKTHSEIYGRIYCAVDINVPDEEQIAKLRKLVEEDKANKSDMARDNCTSSGTDDFKCLYYCPKCPARFFTDQEITLHLKLHDIAFPYKCKLCGYSVPQENDLNLHSVVHSDEYNNKTKMLKIIHGSHPSYKEPKLSIVSDKNFTEVKWVISTFTKSNENMDDLSKQNIGKQYFCKECPAKFLKNSALNYHMGLHGGEGDHKCKKCSYAVKNVGNLAKHELLHEKEPKDKTMLSGYDSGEDVDFKNVPLSGTDLFQRKTQAQKRVSTEKDKLVKPNDHFPPVLQADPQFGYLMHGNPEFIYPTYLKNGRQKEKRYKCHKCPSAFEKREQYKIHLSLHGSKQRYKCELCDYSVKYYANYVQHMKKHQMNDEAQAERKKSFGFPEPAPQENSIENSSDNIKLAIKTMPKSAPKSDFQQFSVSDQQTLRILQHKRLNKTVVETTPTEISNAKERRLHLCMLCPYTNHRLDALETHYNRHDESASGSNKCSHCSLVIGGSHFLRDHLKSHFAYHKNLTPESFAVNQGVSFVITKVDENNVTSVDLKVQLPNEFAKSKESIQLVNIKTGELVSEQS